MNGKGRRAISLAEILVVAAILALLIGLSLRSVMRAWTQAKRTACMTYAYQMGRVDRKQTLRLQLEALDCGCYGKWNGDLGIYTGYFNLPEDMDEDAFRQKLQADLDQAK